MKDGDLVTDGAAFRRMYAAIDGGPVVGDKFSQLGVRYVPPESGLSGKSDITPDAAGLVSRSRVDAEGRPAGMSALLEVPAQWLRHGQGGYAGVGKPGGKAPPSVFAAPVAVLTDGLETAYSGADPAWLHVVVRPTDPVPLETYRAALARTRKAWRMPA